jgi:hypothetical protein
VNATTNSEYRKLELDSSNDMIEHDADRTLGRYPKAAWHILQAGLARERMGQMMFDGGDFTQAAADWLSAAACFDLATDPKRMRDALDRARTLDHEGKIPPERRDLHEALKEREEQLKALEEKLTQFDQGYRRLAGTTHAVGQLVLDFLLQQVRSLPGCTFLHAAIASQAGRLGQRHLAFKHLAWAEKFEPGNPHLESFRASLWLVSEEVEQGIKLSRELLKVHPEMHDLRFLLAKCIAFPHTGSIGNWEEALQLLRPLTDEGAGAPVTRLRAFALAAILRHGFGHEVDYRRHLASFDQLAATIAPVERDFVTELRQYLPQVFSQAGNNGTATSVTQGHHPLTEVDYATVRRVFKRFDEQFNPLAA